MSTKSRLSASVDPELVAAGQAEVAAGRAENLSAWVNHALHRQVEHDRQVRALDEFLAAFEADHGEIGEDEMREAVRRARGQAVVVRGSGVA
ncbi:MAG: hypothetical protein ACR2GH_07835 [Pseudonocardia sp.]